MQEATAYYGLVVYHGKEIRRVEGDPGFNALAAWDSYVFQSSP
jgi:hypothetical protein